MTHRNIRNVAPGFHEVVLTSEMQKSANRKQMRRQTTLEIEVKVVRKFLFAIGQVGGRQPWR